METIFPEGEGFAGFFLVGFRKNPDPPHETQRVATAILKRTYDVIPALNPVLGRIKPVSAPLPVFEQDQPDMPGQIGNLVVNGDFEGPDISVWQPASDVAIARVAEPGGSGDFMLRVTGLANRLVVQTLVMPEALAGFKFTLNFAAKADVSTTVTVELRAGSTTICTISAGLTPAMNAFNGEGRWPSTVSATEMQVVLRTAVTDGRTIFFDDVNVLSRTRFEHDLAPFKPEGDIAVLDFLDVTGLTRFRVNEQNWLERTVNNTDFDMFGWAPRSAAGPNSRKSDAGTFSSEPDAYPPEWPVVNPLKDPLPFDFSNRFYNGYHRQARIDGDFSALPYFPAGGRVRIQRPGPGDDYAFTLGSETVTAQILYYRGYGSDDERYWRGQNISMQADTLVVEPEIDRCYVVWRGVWNFDDHADGVYRRLLISVSEA
jgi:hypothetical protein